MASPCDDVILHQYWFSIGAVEKLPDVPNLHHGGSATGCSSRAPVHGPQLLELLFPTTALIQAACRRTSVCIFIVSQAATFGPLLLRLKLACLAFFSKIWDVYSETVNGK